MGFYNENTQKWECEDECLEKDGNFFCGDTGILIYSLIYYCIIHISYVDHLTSFALLLEGTGGRGCESDGVDYAITYLSIGFAGFALIIIIVFVLINEAVYCIRKIRQERLIRLIDDRENTQFNLN